MNPTTRALEKSDRITPRLAGMKHGDHVRFGLQSGEGPQFDVHYHDRPSYGDSGFQVPGATTGEYTVVGPGGTTEHHHGPHANTESARKRGANPNAKGFAASQAAEQVSRGLHRAHMDELTGMGGIFNDKRG